MKNRFLVLGLIASAMSLNATEITIKADHTVYSGKLQDGALLHGNRDYVYKSVPKSLKGLQYTMHEHKAPASLKISVTKGGDLYLGLFDGLSPKGLGYNGPWQKVATASSTCGGGGEKLTFYKTTVKSGQKISLKSSNRWGSVVLAGNVSGLKPFAGARVASGKKKRRKSSGKSKPSAPVSNSPYTEYRVLAKQIAEHGKWNMPRLEKEALRKDALISDTDKTPIDIVLRRTAALLEHLRKMPKGPKLTEEEAALNALKAENRSGLSDSQIADLFGKITALRRKIAFQNPLLDFDKILFAKHNRTARGDNHMVDQYLGFNQDGRGGIFVLENPFSDKPKAKSLLANSVVENGRLKGKKIDNTGSFMSLELDYDAKTIYFAFTEAEHDKPTNVDPAKMTAVERLRNGHVVDRAAGHPWYFWSNKRTQNIFRVKANGSGLTQLTDDRWNNFDPCVLPNDRIVFLSDRIGGNQRCGTRFCSTYTLHAMMPDGSDVIPLSYHDTNEWQPSVDNNGMIVYTRWDYVDRDSDIAHHIWHCFPDGRDPRSYHGNYPKVRESRPWMEMSIRAIPGSRKYVAVATPHHGQNYGSMVMIDISKTDDGSTSQLKRITPETLFPEAESAPGISQKDHGGKNRYKGEFYGQPWPLDEDFYLCSYNMHNEYSRHALFLIDSFGNRVELYRDNEMGCLDPMPFKPRKRPPVIPTRTLQARADRKGGEDLSMGTVSVMNIYESEYEWPKGTKIKELRIINVFPKPNLYINKPNIGLAAQSLARGVLGTVPVEEDGSCYFRCPTGCPIYFQALDKNGMMVQNMRSATYVHPGESLSCIGCHETKHTTPKTVGKTPIALRRPPSIIKPEAPGCYPLTFPRLVQPVLDKHCVACHTKEKKAPSLRGDKFNKGRSEAFITLAKLAWGKAGGNGALRRNGRSYSLPGKEGARVSKLYQHLAKGHKNVKLSSEEMRRITMWIDCNSNFFGAYTEPEKQAKGEIVKPLLGLPRHLAFERLKH